MHVKALFGRCGCHMMCSDVQLYTDMSVSLSKNSVKHEGSDTTPLVTNTLRCSRQETLC